MHPHRDFWLWAGTALAGVAVAAVAIAGSLLASRTNYPFWSSAPMIVAYVCGGLALVCFFSAVRNVPFPFGLEVTPAEQPYSVIQKPSDLLVSETETARTPEPTERTFIDVTPAYLVGLFEGHTDLQAMELTKPFIGKWIKVSGLLGNVLSNRETISQVTFKRTSIYEPDHEFFTVYMYFNRKQWDERLAVLRPGSAITVIGRIQEFDGVTVHLRDCELED